jgi:hypothetical protein
LAVTSVLLALAAPAHGAAIEAETVAAWNAYVARAAPQAHTCRGTQPCQAREPEGTVVPVPGGTINHWRGSTLVRRTTVDKVIATLMYPGTPPPQEDVLEARVLSRSGNNLRVYLKLSRTAIVTVVYDTEHDVTFERRSPGLAVSRSISTRIVETGGGDRGFLWRLNSYWTYTQVGSDVRIDLQSLSLSRSVPMIVRPVAAPLINRIARESLVRTLETLRAHLETHARV